MLFKSVKKVLAKKIITRFEFESKINELIQLEVKQVGKIERELNLINRLIQSYMPVILRNLATSRPDLNLLKAKNFEALLAIDKNNSLYLTPLNDKILTTEINLKGEWEPHITKWLYENIHSGDVLVNIGANFGYHLINVPNKNIILIGVEPHPETFKLLEINCDLHGVNVKNYNLAITEHSGEIELWESNFNGGDNRTIFFDNSHSVGRVKGLSISDFFSQAQIQPSIVILDTQGTELQIINQLSKQNLPEGFACIFEVAPSLMGGTQSLIKLLGNDVMSIWNLYYLDYAGKEIKLTTPTLIGLIEKMDVNSDLTLIVKRQSHIQNII